MLIWYNQSTVQIALLILTYLLLCTLKWAIFDIPILQTENRHRAVNNFLKVTRLVIGKDRTHSGNSLSRVHTPNHYTMLDSKMINYKARNY